MSTPVVSAIMPVYRGAALVGATIESVLKQTIQDFELVIVDDCSPDDTLAALYAFEDPRIRIIESRINQGPVIARNRALESATGRYIAALDQDDICLPDRFARQIEFLDANPEVVLVGGAADLLENGKVRAGSDKGPTTPELLRWRLFLANPLVWSSVMIRGDIARALQPFTRPEMQFAEDYDLYHRLLPLGRIARIDDVLVHYRIHPGGVSKAYEGKMVESTWRVLREVYLPVFGESAEANARLIVDHVARGDPVPDRNTLDHVGAIVLALRAWFIENGAGDEVLAEIDRSISVLWWKLARTAVRAGKLSARALRRARPKSARLGDMPVGDMLVSSMIGVVRRAAA